MTGKRLLNQSRLKGSRPKKELVDISILVSTCNRGASLRLMLESLTRLQGIEGKSLEIIVVDNNSHDETPEVVESFHKAFPGEVRYCFEKRQGKAYALNAALQMAQGGILVFLDDDVTVESAWLANIMDCFKRHDCDAVGGRVLPGYPARTPRWVKDNEDILGGPIVRHDFGDACKEYDLSCMNPFAGANKAIKRSALKALGEAPLYDVNFGPGKKTYGDDNDLFYRLRDAGQKIFYCGRAVVHHPVNPERMTLRYIARWFIRSGRYYGMTGKHELLRVKAKTLWGAPRYIYRQCFELALHLPLRICNRRKFLVIWRQLFLRLGIVSGVLRRWSVDHDKTVRSIF